MDVPGFGWAAYGQATDEPRVLVFSKTAAFRHGSIPAGVQAIRELGTANQFAVDATEDAAAFTDENLARYDAVVWLSTTGDVLDAPQQAAFERYIQAGGGYAGVHAASDTEYTWNWYGGLVGAYFSGHPDPQSATVEVADHAHPSTKHLPARWTRSDEWYNFQSNPRGKVHVLATLDETTYTGGGMGTDHPIAWCQLLPGRSLLVHGRRPRRRVLHRSAVPQAPARRHPVGRRRAGQRLRRHGQQTTSRRSCSTTTSRARWAWTSRPTAA